MGYDPKKFGELFAIILMLWVVLMIISIGSILIFRAVV